MFEQGVVYVLKKFLAKFVEDGEAIKEKVQLGVWSGLIVLENLRLKNSLLSLVDSPISLSYGYIGRLELRIPWGNLGVDPVVVIIDKVYLVIEPKYEWNPGAADRREQAVKQAKLAAAELFANKRLAATNSASQSYGDIAKNWLMTSFINKIIDNIQITIREVHVRYEDQQSCQTNFCVGFTLESLHVQSRDNSFSFEESNSSKKDVPRSAFAVDSDNMQPELKTQGFETFHKLIQVNHLSMYWNPLVPSGLNVCSCLFKGRPVSEIQAFMYRTIPTRVHQITDRPRHHYILLPVDINNYLDMSFNTTTGVAKANVKLVISELAIQLEDLQVREIISVAINMGSFAKLQRFSEFRPSTGIFQDPKAWWRYAINAVLLQIRIDRKKVLSLRQISLRHRDKLVYTELWKSKLVSSSTLIHQLSQVDDSVKPVLDRDASHIYQTTYNRAKRSLQAAQTKESLQKGPVLTHKGTGKSKFTASLNTHKISSGEEKSDVSIGGGGLFSPGRSAVNAPIVAHVPVQPLNKESIELLQTLEYYLSFEDIVLFRSLAEKNLSLESTTRSWLGGIVSWVGGGGEKVTEEERRKLFEALKYDPDRVLRGGLQEINQNEVMSIVAVQVQQASITLSLTSPVVSSTFQTSIPFLKLELEDLRNRAVIMGDGAHVSVSVSLQDFSAFEILPTTTALNALRNNAPRNKILFRRELRGGSVPSAAQQAEWGQSSVGSRYMDSASVTGSAGRMSLHRRRSEDCRPLFSTTIEILPPNKDTDMVVNLNVEELEIWVSPTAKWTNAMATFVAWPADQQYWSEMEMGAMNQLADFKARFNAKIDYMMQNHQNIIIEASVKAPVVVISDQASHHDKGDVLVIDLGMITLKTEKLAKAQRQKLIDARSHTGFTSDATNATPMHRGRALSGAERFRPPRDDVAVALNFSERKLPAVPESHSHNRATPDWEVLAENEAEGDEDESVRKETPHKTLKHNVPGTAQSMRSARSVKNSLVKANLATLEASYEQEEKSRASDADGDGDGESSHARDSAHDDPHYMSGAYGSNPAPSIGASTIQTGGLEFGQDDETLFDVFQCQISQIEIYLISSGVLSDTYIEDVDLSKTVIMDKFEIGIEIHASVLPWDITIPPVKLVLDIPEINVKLSEPKLLRLKQFSVELITDDSQAMLSANLARINNLNAMLKRKNSDLGAQAKSRLSSRLSLMSNGSSMLNIQRRSRRTMSVGDAGSVSDMNFFDTVTGRNSMNNRNSTTTAMTTSRKSVRGTESKRFSRSRAGSMSQRDLLDDTLPAEQRLRKLVDTSYVVGSEDGDAENTNFRDPQDGKEEEDDGDDDDSFYSVYENISSEEHARQKEHLQFVIAQRESIRSKLMSDIRTSEADPSKAALHDTLKKELVLCEQELQQLRVAFVELLMSNEDLELYNAEEDSKAVQRFHDGLLLPVYSVETGEKLANAGYKRDLAQASVFKVPPTRARQQHNDNSNRELVYVRVNVNIVNVDLECTQDAKLINQITGTVADKSKKMKQSRKSEFATDLPVQLPTVMCRLKLCGIGLKLRHRSQDSRVRMSMQALDVEDFIQLQPAGSTANGANGKPALKTRGASVFLISSDPSNFGLYALPVVNRYNPRGNTDLLSVKYEVLYGADTLDEHGEDVLGDGQDTHNVKVSMGMVGVNIEQSRIALLLLTVHRVLSSAGVITTPKSEYPSSPKPPSEGYGAGAGAGVAESKSDPRGPSSPHPSVASSSSAPAPAPAPDASYDSQLQMRNSPLPNILFQAKIDCVCVSLLAKAEPLLTLHMWALSSSVQSRCQAASVSVRLADVAAYYMKRRKNLNHTSALNPQSGHMNDPGEAYTVEKISIFGRDPSSLLPFLTTSVRYEKDMESNMVPQVIASVKTVPVLLNVDLDCIGEVIREVTEGPVLEIVTLLAPETEPAAALAAPAASAPARKLPAGSVLDGAINPLVDACNGRIEIVTGAFTVICADRPDAFAPRDFTRDANATVANELSMSLRTIEANVMWGDICEFGALQSTLAVQGVQLTCSGSALNDPIDLFVKSAVLPNGHFVPLNQADTVANLTFNTSFPPPDQHEVERNEVQVAVSVSPVLLHVHESLLRSVLNWSDFVIPAAQSIQLLLLPDGPAVDPTVVELVSIPHLDRSAKDGIAAFGESAPPKAIDSDFNVTMCVLLYEVVVSMEVATGPAKGTFPLSTGPATPSSASKHRSGHKKTKHAPADLSPLEIPVYVPIFRLVARKIGSEVTVKAIDDGARTPFSDSGFPSTLLSITCGVDSVDFEHIKFSGATYKRLLSTGNYADHCPSPQMQASGGLSASSSASGLLGEGLFDVTQVEDDEPENLEFRFLTVDMTLQDDLQAKVDVRVDNIHVTMIADAALALIALTDIYIGAVGPAQPGGLKRKTISRGSLHDLSTRSSTHGKIPTAEDTSNYNNYYFAHPSSVPMGPGAGGMETGLAPPAPVAPLPVTLLNTKSFSLAEMLKSIACNVSLSNCFLYVPSERRNGAGPAVCTSLNLEVEVRTHDIATPQWNVLLRNLPKVHRTTAKGRNSSKNRADLPSEEAKGTGLEDSDPSPAASQVFCSARCTIHSIEVFLIKSLPSEICNPVAPLDVASDSIPVREGMSSSPARVRLTRFPAMSPPRSPVRSMTSSSCAPDTPNSVRTSTTSQAGAAGNKDSTARYHSKALVFPFGAEILYSAFVEVRAPNGPMGGNGAGARASSIATDEFSSSRSNTFTSVEADLSESVQFIEGAELELVQRLSMEVQSDLEAQCFLDMRPFTRMYETSIKPVIDAIDAKADATATVPQGGLSARSWKDKTKLKEGSGKSTEEKPAKKFALFKSAASKPAVHLPEGLQLAQLSSLGDVLGALGQLSSFAANVRLPNLIVYVINDIYTQPVSIARMNITGVELTAEIFKPVRDSKVLLLADLVQVGTAYDSEQESEAPTNSLALGMSYLTNNTALLSPGSVRSAVKSAVNQLIPQTTTFDVEDSADETPAAVTWINIHTTATIGVEYYNQRLIAREPLIEPFPLNVHFTMSQSAQEAHAPVIFVANTRKRRAIETSAVASQLRDDALVAEFLTKFVAEIVPAAPTKRTNLDDNQSPALPTPAPMSVLVDIPQPITVNMTMALTEILMVTAQTVSAVDMLHPVGSSARSEKDSDVSILGIRNDSGLVLRYWTHEDMPPEVVPPNTEAPLQVEYSQDLRRGNFAGDIALDGRYTTARYINISLHDAEFNTWPELHDVPLEGVGTRLFNIDFKQQRQSQAEHSTLKTPRHSSMATNDFTQAPSLALELVSKGGSKMLIVRSTIRIFNSTKATFRVELVSGFRSVRRDVLWEAVVPPNQGIPVPANLCNIPNGRFVVKPVLELLARNCEGCFWPVISSSDQTTPLAAEVALPSVPGINAPSGRASPGPGARQQGEAEGDLSDSPHSTAGSSDETQGPAEGRTEPNNFVHWRRKLVQQRGTANMQTYSLWLSLNSVDLLAPTSAGVAADPHQASKDLCSALIASAASVYCNVNVSSKGVPRSTQTQIRSNESCMLRTLTFTAPVTVVNLTAGAIEVAITPDLSKLGHTNNLESLLKLDKHICQIVPQAALSPGESWDFLSAHAYADISISMKFSSNGNSKSTTTVTSLCDVWSDALVVAGCRSRTSDTTTYNVEVPYLNGSRLTVQVEVIDRSGTRVVNIFVPYWVVTSSFLPLQYQHETWYATAADRRVNGTDGLAADQTYTHVSQGNRASGSKGKTAQPVLGRNKVAHSGLGRARGLDGVVLGPSLPTRGLVDVLAPPPGLDRLLSRYTVKAKLAQQKQNMALLGPSALHSALDRYARSPSFSDELLDFGPRGGDVVPWGGAKTNSAEKAAVDGVKSTDRPFSLMQCGYSYKERRAARIRLRTGTTSQWSSYFSLDNAGTNSLEVASTPRDPSAEDADIARVMPHMGNARSGSGGRIFSLGVSITTAEPPFNRTQIVVLVDRYAMINTLGHPIEVRQVGHDSVFTLRGEEQVPLWWSGGSQLLQMRLARYGWSWSGKFPVNAEGEFSIRLRNEFDNTVFFVLVHVLMKGPYMYVVFRGGEKFSPYRFENHTLDTFKIKQKGQAPCTVLLPYHSSAYAWDEPLTPHYVCIEVLKNALQSQDDWGAVGTFSFDALGPLDFKPTAAASSQQYLMLRVVAQGPTRVLQIFDKRILRSNERISPSLPATGKELVNRLSGVRNQLTSLYMASSLVPVSEEPTRRAPMVVHITVNVASVGVSLVDHIPQELIYVSVSGIHVEHSLFPQENITNLEVQRLQVDNQLWSTPYPSLLYPLLSEKTFLTLVLHRDTQYAGMEFIPLLKLFIAPFDINLDGTIIVRLLEMGTYVIELLESSHSTMQSRAYSQRMINAENMRPTAAAQQSQQSQPKAPTGSALFSPIGVASTAVSVSGNAEPPAQASSLSYHDAADFVVNSPYSQSPRGERLRPSQVDSIHNILHTLSAQRQQKHLHFRVPEGHHQSGLPDSKLFSRFSKPPSDLLTPRSRTKDTVAHKVTKSVRFPTGRARAVMAPTVAPEDQTKATLSKYFVHKLLDSMATPSGYANPTAKVYLQKMELSEIRLNASFNPVVANDAGNTSIADENAFVRLLTSALSSVALAVGSAFAKIENAPIRFRPYKLEHVFTSSNNLGMMLASNYGYQAALQSYIVIFSSEVLGNPVRLFYTLGEGLWDFLYLPTVGLFESPTAFVGGAVLGTRSLVRTVFASIFSTAGSLASSLQVGLIALGAVDRYPDREQESRAVPAITDGSVSDSESRRNSIDGLLDEELAQESASSVAVRSRLHAVQSVQAQRPRGPITGLQMAIAGVIFDPLVGFRVDGMQGLMVGLAKGTLGLIARPLYGSLGYVSDKLDDISFYFQPRFLANQKLRLQRVRSPRFFRHPNQPLRVYSNDENMGQDLLSRIHHGDYRREGYLWHAVLKDKCVLLMTKARILIISNGFETGEILWNCPTNKIRSLEVEYTKPSSSFSAEDTTRLTNAALSRLSKQANLNITKDAQQHSTMTHTQPVHTLSSNSLLNFECALEGEPVLHIYHEPLSGTSSTTPNKGSSKLGSGRKEASKSSGFRLAHKILRVASHRQLLELFNYLLRLLPSLASGDVLKYLTDAGINVSEALRQQSGQKQRMGINK